MMKEDFLERDKLQDLCRWYVNRFVKKFTYIRPSFCLISDSGAVESINQPFLSHREYKAVDLAVGECNWNNKNTNYIGDLDEIPNRDEIFDAVLCTQVLEYLERPRGLSMSPSSGLRRKKTNILTIGLIKCRMILVLVVSLLQFTFLWLDKFNKSNDDTFGCADEVQKW
jgi:hypothetical protein